VPGGQQDLGLPRVEVDLKTADRGGEGKVKITLHNDGGQPLRYELTGHDFLDDTQVVHLAPGKHQVVPWPTRSGYYDVVITADTGTGWTQRYAGRVATAE
jgi:phospholipase C